MTRVEIFNDDVNFGLNWRYADNSGNEEITERAANVDGFAAIKADLKNSEHSGESDHAAIDALEMPGPGGILLLVLNGG